MKNRIQELIVMVFAAMACFSCSKDVAGFEEIDGSAAGNTILKVRTRAAEGSGGTVSSPINIYVFNDKSKCVAYKQASTENEDISFKFAEGTYKVYSIAGADNDTYNLPTMDDATEETVITRKEGKQHGDIMTSKGEVRLENDVDSESSLKMSRKVLMLSSVTINNVPDGIASIAASISPIYEDMKIDGEYTGKNGVTSITLSKTDKSSVWKSDCNLYMLPSVGNPLIKFTFTYADGSVKNFTYTSEKPLLANYKVSMAVNYVQIKEPTLKCVITGVEWNGDEEWSFDANEKDFTTDDKGNTTPSDDKEGDTNIPQVGELYKGCYVLKTVTDGNTTTLTLLAPKNKKGGFTYDVTKQESIKAEVDAAIKQLAVNGIDEFRLPTKDEMAEIKANNGAINKAITALNLENMPLSFAYLILDTDNNIKAFSMGSGQIVDLKTSCYLRPFATVKITK